jgi:hypothetical protein
MENYKPQFDELTARLLEDGFYYLNPYGRTKGVHLPKGAVGTVIDSNHLQRRLLVYLGTKRYKIWVQNYAIEKACVHLVDGNKLNCSACEQRFSCFTE